MKRTLLRATLAAGIVASSLVAVGAAGAQAAVIGSARPSVTSGGSTTLFNVISSAPCPAGAGGITATIDHASSTGGTDWEQVGLIGFDSASLAGIASTGAPIADSLFGLAAANGTTLDAGVYTITLTCMGADVFDPPLGDFVGTITATGSGASFAWTYDAPATPSSTTTLTTTPATSADLGDSVTLTANVASTAAVAGTVQFKANGTNVGTPQAVTAGVATLTTTALPAGPLSLTAEFIPSNPSTVQGSTSAAVAFTVVAPAQATTTALSSSPAAPTTADVVVLTAAVTPAAATGTVTFREGATVLGTAPVTSGAATLSLTPGTLAAGAHDITASFAPANPAVYLASTSDPATVTVGAFAGYALNGVPGGGELIQVTIEGGSLTLTAATTPVDLGSAALNATNTALETAPKDINPVTVTDTRAGSPGYTVSGIAGDFSGPAGAKINSENLGWTPKTVGTVPSTITITPGPAVAPADAIAPSASSTPVAGLKASRVLAAAAAGASTGTVQIGASLVLKAPTTTPAGLYSTTLVITAI